MYSCVAIQGKEMNTEQKKEYHCMQFLELVRKKEKETKMESKLLGV